MAQIFREYLKPLLPNAHHQRCVAHVLNLVGGDLLGSEFLADVKKLQTLVRSFTKGKRNVSRRRRLAKLTKTCPPDPCQTRWNSWYKNAVWTNSNLGALKAFVNSEIDKGSTNAQMLEVRDQLQV